MLSLDFIRNNKDKVIAAVQNKNSRVDISLLMKLDNEYRALQQSIQELRKERNDISAQKTNTIQARGKEIKLKLKELEQKADQIYKKLYDILIMVPNIPLDDVPIGKDETENKVIRKWGNLPKFDFQPKDHIELATKLDLLDIETAGYVSGPRFVYLKNQLVLLQYALINYVLSILTSKPKLKTIAESIEVNYPSTPFIPIIPPVFIKPEIYTKMARLDPIQKEDRYYLEKENQYLIGSAEHTLGPLHANQMLFEKDLPKRYVGISTCFRRESGSYGKDVRGMLRTHQFDKIEMESFTTSVMSKKEQDFIVAIQEYIMQTLQIPYQVVMICTGDMGGPDARQIDIEAWMPGQNKYRETHTSDLMTDYQSRRLKTKVKLHSGESEYVHMNDATAIALSRMPIAILENYQQKDGSISIPKILVPYTGFDVITVS